MNTWGQSCQAVNQSLQSAVDAMEDLATCFRRDIEGKNRVPLATARQMGHSLAELRDSLIKLTVSVSGVADAQSRAILSFLAGNRLDREEFYILLATECVEWTNKNIGLSDFDDYELFDLLRFEGADKSGYIYLAPDIDALPDVDPDDWTLQFISQTYRKAIIPPESIEWRDLSSRQRVFFRKHLPETVSRFIHENPVDRSKVRVDMRELVSALKALKVHLKARRKLSVLIRRGDSKGKLVLELSGRSKYAGMLTTVNCIGDWNTEALAPGASFRGFVTHPPIDQTSYLSFRDGRLHIGNWSCPARPAGDVQQ
jgi:hypothetical protein